MDKQEIAKSLEASHFYGENIPGHLKDEVDSMAGEKKKTNKAYVNRLVKSGYKAPRRYKRFVQIFRGTRNESLINKWTLCVDFTWLNHSLRKFLTTASCIVYRELQADPIQVTDNSQAYFSEVDSRKKIVILSFEGSKRKPKKISIGGF